MDKEIVYVAELDADVDDVVAAHYLHDKGVLKCVVCDPYPRTEAGLKRKAKLESLGVQVLKKMPPIAKYVFVGGALTVVANYIKTHHIDMLVMNGGFVGSNIAPVELEKFKGKETVRTFNFNCDVSATDYVLKAGKDRISEIVLVGKNVCHDARNTIAGIWKDGKYQKLFDAYNVKNDKRQHDMLACHEGLAFLNHERKYCKYDVVRPFHTGLNWTYTKWGSTKTKETPYREVFAAVCFESDIVNSYEN